MISQEALGKSRILCDTDVISYVFNNHTQAQFFTPYLKNKTLAISFMSVAQLYYGAYHADWATSKLQRLENYLKNYVILPYDYSVCLKWAEIRKELEKDRLVIEQGDCWIAASALKYDCALATNNARHFTPIRNLLLICPSLS